MAQAYGFKAKPGPGHGFEAEPGPALPADKRCGPAGWARAFVSARARVVPTQNCF